MKNIWSKSLIAGMIIGCVGTSSLAAAGSYLKQIMVDTKPITMVVDGTAIQKQSINTKTGEYFNGKEYVPTSMGYKGTMYVPLRLVADSFGKKVTWDEKNRTATFINKSDIIEDVAKPVSNELLIDNGKTIASISIPKDIQAWVDEQKRKTHNIVKFYDGYTYILLARGEVSNAGYGIEFNNMLEFTSKVEVRAAYVEPRQDARYAQVISYPYTLLRVKGEVKKELVYHVAKPEQIPSEQLGIWAGKMETTFAYKQTADNQLEFTFITKNQTPYELKLNFPSMQKFNYVIINDKGKEIYNYAMDKLFAQVKEEKSLKQGEELTFTDQIQKLTPGKYTLVYKLTSTEHNDDKTFYFEVK